MKKLIYTLLFVSTAVLTSCSSDDDDSSSSSSLDNEITIDGDSVEVDNALLEDYGPELFHYNNDFTLQGTSGDDTFLIFVELFSPLFDTEGSGFTTGTFEFNDNPDSDSFYFDQAAVSINNTIIAATGGTVTVSGSGTNYDIEISLTLLDGTTATANYDGEFDFTEF